MSSLGERLQEIRERAGIRSQQALAERLGVAKNRVWSYEKGKTLPDLDYLAEFCVLTGGDFQEVLQLRLAESGHAALADALIVSDTRADYRVESAEGDVDRADYARQAILQISGLDPSWALAIMELAARGDISRRGVDRLLEFIRGKGGRSCSDG